MTRWVPSPFGQQAAIFGRDEKRVGRLVGALVPQVSRINLNSQCQRGPDAFPFTGRKASAEGTLSVTDPLRVFSIRTMVAARDDDANRALVSSIVATAQTASSPRISCSDGNPRARLRSSCSHRRPLLRAPHDVGESEHVVADRVNAVQGTRPARPATHSLVQSCTVQQ